VNVAVNGQFEHNESIKNSIFVFMKQVDRTIAPEVTEYGHLEFPRPTETTVCGCGGGEVRIMSLNRCPEPVSRVTVVWPTGLMDCDRLPIASIAPAALREGTSLRSASEISSALESNGAWLAAETVQEYTLLHLYALNRRLRPVLDVLHEIIADPVFPTDRIDALRLRHAEAARQNQCKVAFVADRELRPLMTGKNHRRSRVSTPEEILSTGSDDVRCYWEMLKKDCVPTVWIAGNVTDDVMNSVSEFASGLAAAETGKNNITVKTEYSAEEKSCIVTGIEDARQAAVAMGMTVPDVSHRDHILLRMAVSALGGYFGSRLNANIREDKGLTYGIGASVRMSPQGAYLFIQAQADESYIDQVIEETANEMRGLWKNRMNDHELLAVRRNQQMRLAGMLDSPFATLDYCLAMQQTGAGIDFFDRTQDALDFSANDIARVAELYLNPDKLSVSIARKL
jgi:predicted Zn-dependent peptidase